MAAKGKDTRGPRGRKFGREEPAPTPLQANAIALLQDRILGKNTLSVEEILLKAGYSPESAKQQTNVLYGIRQHLDPFVERLERLRDAALDKMEIAIESASYADATRAVHTLTHNIRLTQGKTTSNVGVIVDDRREELDRLTE